MKIHSKLNNNFFKYITILAAVTTIIGFGIHTAIHNNANATSAKDFNAGNIISDYVFYNKDSMSANQIQDFLNNIVGSCDTWGSQKAVDWGRGDITRAQFAKQSWNINPPFVCLNNYHENPQTGETSYEKGGGWFDGGISASHIIYEAAQKYGINPQVLLVMLKKESSGPLTSDKWPIKNQYKYAMGYACPDSGPNNSANCTATKAGFYKQINLAAWQLKYYREHPNDYRYSLGWNDIQYSPNIACGTKRVYIENIATLSLYIYTPYTPNDGALKNYPGTSHCGAYGNRNFFMFFSEWFGSTIAGYSIDITKANRDIDAAYVLHKNKLGSILTDRVVEFDSTPRIWQTFQNGTIIWTSQTGAHPVFYGDIYNRWRKLGGSTGVMGVPVGVETVESSDSRSWQSFRNGVVIYSNSTGAWDLQNGPILNKWRSSGGSMGYLGKPTSGVVISNNMRKQAFERGIIIRRNVSSPAYIIRNDIYNLWNSDQHQKVLRLPIGDQVTESSDGRVWQYFDGGIAIHTSNTFFIKNGSFYNEWRRNGGSNGSLGKPTSNQIAEPGRSWQSFERGIVIQKTGSSTAHTMLYGSILSRWRTIGGSSSELGLPVGNSYTETDGRSWQQFENGYVISSPSTGTWEVLGGFYKYWSSQGGSTGRLGKPLSERVIKPDGVRWQQFERGKAVWSLKFGWKTE